MSDVVDDFNKNAQELGQSLQFVSNGKPNPILWGVIYWGNNRSDGGASSVFELKIDGERGGWFNDAMGMFCMFGGKAGLTKYKPGFRQGCYVSPNQNDASIFLAAYLAAMNLTIEPKEHSKDVLWAACLMCKLDKTLVYGMAKCFIQEDGTWLDETGKLSFKKVGFHIHAANPGLNLGVVALTTHNYQLACEYNEAFYNACSLLDMVNNPDCLKDDKRFEAIG